MPCLFGLVRLTTTSVASSSQAFCTSSKIANDFPLRSRVFRSPSMLTINHGSLLFVAFICVAPLGRGLLARVHLFPGTPLPQRERIKFIGPLSPAYVYLLDGKS